MTREEGYLEKMSKPTTYDSTQMCNECPFRANAIPGWLGPYTVEQLHNLIHRNESHMLCHTRLKKAQHCVGALRYMNSVCRQSRDEERFAAQKRLREIPDKQELIKPFQFRSYHDQENVIKTLKGTVNGTDSTKET